MLHVIIFFSVPEAESVQDCILTPAPVANKKTVDGSVTFDQLILPSPPPVYRPFMEDEKMKEKLLKHNASKSKLNKKDLEGIRILFCG